MNVQHEDAAASVILYLARDVHEITEALRSLQLGLIGVGVALALVMSVAIGYGINHGMRPMDHLAAQVSKLYERSLGQQIDLPGLPRELEPVVVQFNKLSQRLGVAFERERTFSADIAHELRMPLTCLRTTIDVILSKQCSPQEYKGCLQQFLDVAKQMHIMVQSLIQLATLESGHVPGQ